MKRLYCSLCRLRQFYQLGKGGHCLGNVRGLSAVSTMPQVFCSNTGIFQLSYVTVTEVIERLFPQFPDSQTFRRTDYD